MDRAVYGVCSSRCSRLRSAAPIRIFLRRLGSVLQPFGRAAADPSPICERGPGRWPPSPWPAAIIGALRTSKFHHSGIKLTVADFALASSGTIPFLVAQYRRAAMAVLRGWLSRSLSPRCATLVLAEGRPLPLELRALLFAAALGACGFSLSAQRRLRSFRSGRTVAPSRSCSPSFMASVIRRAFLVAIARTGPERRCERAPAARDGHTRAHHRHARHHSHPARVLLFDPRLFGLAVDPNIEALLSPANRPLRPAQRREIYGGGSWQSKFSLLTGLSSSIFGPNAYFIFQKGVGRFPSHPAPGAPPASGTGRC